MTRRWNDSYCGGADLAKVGEEFETPASADLISAETLFPFLKRPRGWARECPRPGEQGEEKILRPTLPEGVGVYLKRRGQSEVHQFTTT